LIFHEIYELKNNNFVSFKDLRIILKKIKKNLEKQQITDEYIILDLNNSLTKQNKATLLNIPSFHSCDDKIVAKRKKIFMGIQDTLIQKIFFMQYTEFRKILAKSMTKHVTEIIKKQHQNLFYVSQFISMLSYFCALRDFPFIANCFQLIYYQSYYTELFTSDFTYKADRLSKEKIEKKRKKILKYGIQGEKSDPDKTFVASPANFIQAFDAEILRKVIAKFLKRFPDSDLWIRHDCFVVSPENVPSLVNFYKEAFVDTFFTNNQTFQITETAEKFYLSKDNPLYIFQILIISNLFNLLDYSLHEKSGSLTKEDFLILEKKHDFVKKLLLNFLKEPTLENITKITFSIDGTIFGFNDPKAENKKKKLEEIITEKQKKLYQKLVSKEQTMNDIISNLKIQLQIEKDANKKEVLNLTRNLEQVKISENSKDIKKAKKDLKKKENFKSKIEVKLKSQLTKLEKIHTDKNNVYLEQPENLIKMQINDLSKRYNKIKDLKDLNLYKKDNQLELILILYVILERNINESSFKSKEILQESNPLS